MYKSFSISTTSNGVLWTQSSVNPTKSLKNIVTQSKFSASTFSPRFSDSATVLFELENVTYENKNLQARPQLTSEAFSVEALRFFSSPHTANWFVAAPNPRDYKHTSPLSPAYCRKYSASYKEIGNGSLASKFL